MLKLAKESSSSSSKADDEVSDVATEPVNVADITTISNAPPTLRAAKTAEKGIIIREPTPEEPTPKEFSVGKGKKKLLLLHQEIQLPHQAEEL